MIKRRLISVITLGSAFIMFITVGIYREEFVEVIINATLLCFSCIGIK